MKRFLQKSYSWLATLLLAVAFAVSGSAAAQGIELPFAFTTSAGGTVDGVGFYMWSANWYDSTELYGEGDASATWGTVNLTSPAKNIVKVELTCRTNSWSGVGSAAAAAATVCETEDLGGSFTTNGAVAIWQGSAHKLTFSSTDDIDVYKMVVYLEEGEVVKECTVGVDHYADNCKPGKHETPFSRYITLYMQENAATTTWTGSDNCPAEVTLTNEAGQKLPISQFNYWQNSDQIGVVLEENITTPGVYTLHIPEGLVPFASGKFNKEINTVWTIVEPDTRPTKDVVFDFTDGTYTNDGTLSYTKDGVVFTLNENRWNAQAQGFRIGTDGWVSFAAPEKATIKSIQLLQESSYGVSPDFSANVGEVSVYDRTLYWSGDDASVTLTDNYGTCYFTKAIVTLAVEEPSYVEPVLKAEDVSAEVAYYIFTDARGGLTVDGDQLKGTKEVGKDVDPTDVAQQFAFVNWEGNLYLYSLAAEKFIGKANRGNFTEEPVDPIYFKSADESTVMLYFDDSFNFNLGGSNQVTIDTWKTKDAGNSFKIMVADKFDQTALLEKLANGGGEVEPTTTFKGVVTPNLTSVSSLAELEGIQLTLVDADNVSVLEESYGIYVQNEDGNEVYAVWHPYYGGTYEIDGNVITLRNFYSDSSTSYFAALPTGKSALYFEDYGTFGVSNADAEWDGYFQTFSVAFEGAPVPVPFELVFRNNNVVCENGKKVEANEAGVGADFYLVNEGLTAVGKTATLYKDGNAMSFVMTLVDGTAISFLGGSSLITEPGTYLLEVPEGTYVDAAGNPSIAFYGQWVVIQKDEPTYTEPVLSAEDVSAEVAYYIYTDARGGLTVDGDQLKGTKEVGKNVDPTDVAQQFAFVNWEGNLYLYSLAAEKFIGKANRGNFTEEPVDPIYFKNAAGGTVMLYFDDSFNFNLGGSNQVTIDNWKTKDAGNSFKIMVAEKFDQTALLDKLAGGGEVVDPVEPTDLSIFAGEWYFKGEGAYLDYYEENVTPKDEYVVNVAVENGKLYMTDLVGFVYDVPNAFIGTYDAQAETLTFNTPYTTCYVVDDNYEYYTNFKPLVFNVVKDEEGNVSLVNTTGWDFMYEDWYYTTYACGYTSCVMTREQQIVEPEPEGWNGEIVYSEANSLDDLLTLTIEFEEAKEVEAAGGDVLGVVFEENGNPYAIVLGNGVFDVFGGVNFDGSKATVEFVKIADLSADLQASAKAAAARIGGFTQTPGEASVVFAGKSFKVDGQLVTDIIAKNYTFEGGVPTGIESINSYANDVIYDLSGRRVTTTNNGGLYIKNGRKVYMK